RNDRRSPVVVAGVQDVAHCVPDPLCRLYRAEFVENEHFGLEHRPENFQFRGLDARVVGVLYFLQQLAIVVKETGGIFLNDKLPQNANRQVRLAYADRPEQHQASILYRILLNKSIGLEQSCWESAIGSGEIRIEVREGAMFVACGNPSLLQQPL